MADEQGGWTDSLLHGVETAEIWRSVTARFSGVGDHIAGEQGVRTDSWPHGGESAEIWRSVTPRFSR